MNIQWFSDIRSSKHKSLRHVTVRVHQLINQIMYIQGTDQVCLTTQCTHIAQGSAYFF